MRDFCDLLRALPQQVDLVWRQHPGRGRGTDEPIEQHSRRGDSSSFRIIFQGLFHVCSSVGRDAGAQAGMGGSTRTVIMSVSWYCWWRTDEA